MTSFEQVNELELGHNHLRIVILDTHDGEHAWVDCQCIEVGMILKTVLEPDQLLNEAHVGVSARSSFLNSLVTLLVSDTFSQDQVGNANSGRARDTLNTMDIAFATRAANLLQELEGVIENTGDVFLAVIFQVIALVNDTFLLMVITTVVCRAVDNMSDSQVIEYVSIFGNKISAQVEEIVDNLRANALVELILVLLS